MVDHRDTDRKKPAVSAGMRAPRSGVVWLNGNAFTPRILA